MPRRISTSGWRPTTASSPTSSRSRRTWRCRSPPRSRLSCLPTSAPGFIASRPAISRPTSCISRGGTGSAATPWKASARASSTSSRRSRATRSTRRRTSASRWRGRIWASIPGAARTAARVIEFDPRAPRGHSTLGWAKLKMGQHAEGLAELEQAVALDPGNTLFLAQLGQAFAEVGRVADARAVLRQLQQMTTQRDVSPYHLAYVYVGLGDQEAALDALERAFV